MSEETIAETLRDEPEARSACEQLVELALRAGGPDNVSAIVADVVDTDAELQEKPIVGGAAAETAAQAATAADEDTPAARAADLGRRPSESADAPDDTDDDEDDGRRSRLPWVIGLVLVLVIAGIVGTFLYARTQYYVGASKSTPATVTIYRGVSGSVLGIDLNERADVISRCMHVASSYTADRALRPVRAPRWLPTVSRHRARAAVMAMREITDALTIIGLQAVALERAPGERAHGGGTR